MQHEATEVVATIRSEGAAYVVPFAQLVGAAHDGEPAACAKKESRSGALDGQAIMGVREGGVAVMVGIAPLGTTGKVDITRLVRRKIRVHGS